jgi:hypothetical protein
MESMTISGTELHAEVERIAALGNRRCGSDVEHRAIEYVRDRFSEIGLQNPEIEWFDMHRWNSTHAELTLLPGGNPLRCKPIWYTGSTSAEGTIGESVYCDYGLPHQLGSARDKIAVIDSRILLHFWPTYRFFESYKYAVESGAIALVVIIDAPGDMIPVFTADEEKRENPIPAVLISRSDGALLKKRMENGATNLRLVVEAETSISRTADVVATLPGTTNEYIIVGAHHDSIYQGAVDNAGGMAALIAIAKELAARPEPLEKSIIFATHPGHELLIGAREFIKKRGDILSKTAVYITLDGIGSDNYEEIDGTIQKTGRDEARGVFISRNPILAEIIFPILKKHRLLSAAFLPADLMCPNEDLEGRFMEAGLPIVDIIGKPIWYHTEEDTPDKCTPDQLLRGTLAHLEIIEQISARGMAELHAADGQLSDPRSLIIPSAATGSTPTIDFTYLPESPKAGEPSLIYVNFFEDNEGILVDMNWDIDGEAGSKGPVLLHVFDSPGDHAVVLTVTNDLGAESDCKKTIRVA